MGGILGRGGLFPCSQALRQMQGGLATLPTGLLLSLSHPLPQPRTSADAAAPIQITTVNQSTGEVGKEPLRELTSLHGNNLVRLLA